MVDIDAALLLLPKTLHGRPVADILVRPRAGALEAWALMHLSVGGIAEQGHAELFEGEGAQRAAVLREVGDVDGILDPAPEGAGLVDGEVGGRRCQREKENTGDSNHQETE